MNFWEVVGIGDSCERVEINESWKEGVDDWKSTVEAGVFNRAFCNKLHFSFMNVTFIQ